MIHKSPAVAVVLATFNGERYLKRQLDSLLSQTYGNFKICISDDCSSDDTLKIVRSYKERFPDKVFYTVNAQNVGYVKNFEKLLARTRERYIAFCDQDDIWESEKLEVSMSAMLEMERSFKQKPLLVHSDLSMIDEKGALLSPSYFTYRNYRLNDERDLGHILGPCGVMGNTVLINAKLRELVLPFPKKLDNHDYWVAVNAELFGVRKTLCQPLVRYRIHKKNTSNALIYQEKRGKKAYRDMQLPNMDTKRKFYLPQLLEKIENADDRKVLTAYVKYLHFDGTKRVRHYWNLLRYSLVKRGVLFRVKLLLKMLFTRRYDKKV